MSSLDPKLRKVETLHAIASALAYTLTDGNSFDKAEPLFSKYGFSYQPLELYWNEGMATFKHKFKNHYIIALKGTDPHSSTGFRDLMDDVSVALTTEAHNENVYYRNDTIKLVIQLLRHDDPTCTFTLCGHSLGATVVYAGLINLDFQFIIDNIDQAFLFNPGASPLLKYKPIILPSQLRAKIKEKSTVLHIEGDGISEYSFRFKSYFKKFKMESSFFSSMLKNALKVAFIKYTGIKAEYVDEGTDKLYGTYRYHGIQNFIV